MTSQPRPVTEEPVRGSVPPPWFFGLPGIERVSALAKGLIPRNPLGHLFGLNLGNVGAGTATVRMPASANFLGPPFMEVSPVLYVALWNAATTTIPAGFDVVPVTVSQQYFRPPRPQPGNLLARARTLNASSVFVCASPVKAYDTDENRVLRHALSRVRDAARDADPTGHSHGDDEQIRRARHNGTRAIRALEHRTLASVSKAKPNGRALQKARTGSRARIYRPAVELLQRASSVIDPKAVADYCDDHTRRQHGLLLALADRLKLGEFHIAGQVLTNHGLRFIHRHRADEEGMHGVLLRNLLLDVPDPANGIDAAQAERNLLARSREHPVLIIKGPTDVELAIRLTNRR